jgi:hypothetical protein
MIEEFKEIKEFPNYEVSNLGTIRNKLKGNTIKGRVTKLGYRDLRFSVRDESGKVISQKAIFIHRLVAEAFIENPDNKPFVDHIDNDKLNNNFNNLRWCTCQENNRNKSIQKNNTNKIKGVYFNKNANKYRAYIMIDGININLGYFKNIEDAKQARVQKVNEAFGNFIHKSEQIV